LQQKQTTNVMVLVLATKQTPSSKRKEFDESYKGKWTFIQRFKHWFSICIF